jgi:hypothetical protein
MAFQLACKLQVVPDFLLKLYHDNGSGTKPPTLHSLQEFIVIVLQSLGKAFIVVDAIDECVERDRVLSWIKGLTLNHIAEGKLHILVTSRNEPDIANHLASFKTIVLDEFTKDDIGLYINLKMETSALQFWDTAIKTEILTALMKNAGGM